MFAPHEAPLFPRLTGAGVFRMLHGWRLPAPGLDSCPAAWCHSFAS